MLPVADLYSHIVAAGRVADTAVDKQVADRVADRVAGRVAGRVADRVVAHRFLPARAHSSPFPIPPCLHTTPRCRGQSSGP